MRSFKPFLKVAFTTKFYTMAILVSMSSNSLAYSRTEGAQHVGPGIDETERNRRSTHRTCSKPKERTRTLARTLLLCAVRPARRGVTDARPAVKAIKRLPECFFFYRNNIATIPLRETSRDRTHYTIDRPTNNPRPTSLPLAKPLALVFVALRAAPAPVALNPRAMSVSRCRRKRSA